MSNLSDRAAYLRGLAEGLGVDESTNEGKLIVKLLELVGGIVEEHDELREEVRELNEYVESIDDDIAEFFQDFDDDEDDDDDFDDDDFDLDLSDDDEDDDEDEQAGVNPFSFSFHRDESRPGYTFSFQHDTSAPSEDDDGDELDDSAVVACICPECNEMFGVDRRTAEGDALFACPHCNQPVPAIMMVDEDMPVAKLIEDEDGEE